MSAIFIFRRDLRIADNTALNMLIKLRVDILPIFIFNPIQADQAKNKYFSQKAFDFLTKCVKELGVKIYHGDDIEILAGIIKKENIKYIGFNLDYTPFARRRDDEIIKWAGKNKIEIIAAEDYSLLSMVDIKPYKIFTPFWNKYGGNDIRRPANVTFSKLAETSGREDGLAVLKKKFDDYSAARDNMSADRTTHLSHLIKFGVISIREVYHAFLKYGRDSDIIKELFWRDFYAMTAYYYPDVLAGQVGKKNTAGGPEPKWSYAKVKFEKWCNGQTGYPIVDAAMKQLAETGWMHNRARMIVASFLIKDLHIDWREGERFFAQNLIDYDPASNSGGWLFMASLGNDSQPYFRVFSPWRQTESHDPAGLYIKRWLPAFKNIPADDIIKWKTKYKNYDYIKPMVDHEEEAKKAIKDYADL